MKPKEKNRKLHLDKNGRLWQLHQKFAKIAETLDRLPDAATVQRNRLRAAPTALTTMVF